MTNSEAAEHLAKAVQFFAVAEFALEAGMTDAATSNAVLAGIRASDAICAMRTGRYSRAKGHAEAVALVRQAGPEGRTAATLLSRLLAVKSKAQYDTTMISSDAAQRAVEGARKLMTLARQVRAG